LSDDIVGIVDTLGVVKPKIKEETSMSELNQASEKLEKLTDRDVRIIYLPPMTVASAHYIGEDCESVVCGMIDKFIEDTDLLSYKPDVRHFTFNNPEATATGPSVGFECWISIPDDWEVPEPLRKVQFFGGLYAVHSIDFTQFDHYGLLWKWIEEKEGVEHAWGDVRWTPHDEHASWCLDESLPNKAFRKMHPDSKMEDYLDIMIPIKEKK
jgi:DNA gyrase inhibitor GyrI